MATATHEKTATAAGPNARQLASSAPPVQLGASLAAAAQTVSAARGRARQLRRVFESSMIPMAIVDNDRRYLEANKAARLLLRMRLSELRRYRIDDFTPHQRLPALEAAWREVVDDASSTGSLELRLADGSRLPITYHRLANVLPGRHLSVFAPAHWPEHELGTPEGDGEAISTCSLSVREREVLSLVATGADLREIADELTISPATVRTHIANVHRKLGTRNRAHAVAVALQHGVIRA